MIKNITKLNNKIKYENIYNIIKNVPNHYLIQKTKIKKFTIFSLSTFSYFPVKYYIMYLCNKNKNTLITLPFYVENNLCHVANIHELTKSIIIESSPLKLKTPDNTYYEITDNIFINSINNLTFTYEES